MQNSPLKPGEETNERHLPLWEEQNHTKQARMEENRKERRQRSLKEGYLRSIPVSEHRTCTPKEKQRKKAHKYD